MVRTAIGRCHKAASLQIKGRAQTRWIESRSDQRTRQSLRSRSKDGSSTMINPTACPHYCDVGQVQIVVSYALIPVIIRPYVISIHIAQFAIHTALSFATEVCVGSKNSLTTLQVEGFTRMHPSKIVLHAPTDACRCMRRRLDCNLQLRLMRNDDTIRLVDTHAVR